MPRAATPFPVSLSSLSVKEGDGVRLERGETLFRCLPLSPLHLTSCVPGVESFIAPTSSCNWHPLPGGMTCEISASVATSEVSRCTPFIWLYKLGSVDSRKTVGSAPLSIPPTLSMVILGVALSDAVASLAPLVIPRFSAAFNGGSESGETTSTGPPFLGIGDSGRAAARACSSSRCFFFLIAKSLKDILTFGAGGVKATSGGDCSGGGSEGSGAAKDM